MATWTHIGMRAMGNVYGLFGLWSNSPSDGLNLLDIVGNSANTYLGVHARTADQDQWGWLMASDDAGNQKPNSPNATHPLQVPLSLETYMREPVNIHNTEATARTAKRIENLAGITSQQVTTAAMGCTGLDVMPIDDRTDREGINFPLNVVGAIRFSVAHARA